MPRAKYLKIDTEKQREELLKKHRNFKILLKKNMKTQQSQSEMVKQIAQAGVLEEKVKLKLTTEEMKEQFDYGIVK